METLTAPSPARTPRTHTSQVLLGIEEFCDSLKPGDRIPSRSELVQRFDASERAVVRALDDLERAGRIVRRKGSGVYVAEPQANEGGIPSGASARGVATQELATQRVAPQAVASNTIVAVGQPDRGYFDYAMHLLYGHVEARELVLDCRFVDSGLDTLDSRFDAQDNPQGFIVFRNDLFPLAKLLHARGHRVVLIGSPTGDGAMGVPNVYANHERGGYSATKHLLELGHRRVAFRAGTSPLPPTHSGHSNRLAGHLRAVAEARRRGHEVANQEISQELFAMWCAEPPLARRYFTRPDAPTGLIMWNDGVAFEMLSFLQFVGLRVPEDISMIGYDNLPEGGKVFPALTSIDTNLDQQLESALGILAQEPESDRCPTIITVPSLVRRASTAPPRSANRAMNFGHLSHQGNYE